MIYALIAICILGLGALIYGWLDTRRFALRRMEIRLDRLPPAFDGFTILQVSDLHNNAYGPDGLDLIRVMEGLSFDVVAITGDLLDRHRPARRDKGYGFAREAAKRWPTYFIQGNHEWRIGGWEAIKEDLTQMGVRVLDNERVSIARGGDRLDLLGISEKVTLKEMQTLIVPNTCSVLLAHHPERIDDYACAGADLVLSGHAHGGQVRLFGQGLYSPGQGVLPRYTSGVYARGKTQLYVSRGAGNHSFLPPRVFNRPQIDLITLKAKTPSR